MTLSDDLNINQRAAVEWSGGPLLVLAGPGSGKTRVLTEHIAHIIETSPQDRFRVLALTFTNKAASEMRSRLESRIPHEIDRVRATTFHSFAAEILRQHGAHVGVRPDFSIASLQEDRQLLLADAVNASAADEMVEPNPKLLPLIDRLLERGATDDELPDIIKDQGLLETMKRVYPNYRQQMIEQNRLDFASLLYFARRLLAEKPAVSRQVRVAYKHVCVDEFQDTNLGQYRLLHALIGDGPENLFVVADDDQVIYQWNGASLARLDKMRRDYDMTTVQLPTNYRCPADVIEIANRLISHNKGRTAGKLPSESARSMGEPSVWLRQFASLPLELEWVADDIEQRPGKERGNTVVLGRSRKLVAAAAAALEARGIPFALGTRKDRFESPQMRWLLATLRLSLARGDMSQLQELSSSFYQIEGIRIDSKEVEAYASACGGDLLRSWFQRTLEGEQLGSATRHFLEGAKRVIVERLDFRQFSTAALEWGDAIEDRLNQAGNPTGDYADERDTWLAIARDVDARFGADEVTVGLLLQEFDLSPKTPKPPRDSVQCLTIHGAKGLEFAHVYLVGLVEDQLPAYGAIRRGPDSQEMEEERRNCFVAITRAQDTLSLSYSDEYFGWGCRPSRFLDEMGLL